VHSAPSVHEDTSLRAGEEIAHAWRAVRYAFGAGRGWAALMLIFAIPSIIGPGIALAATAAAVTAAAADPNGAGFTQALLALLATVVVTGLMTPVSNFAVGEMIRRSRLRARGEVVTILVSLRSLQPWDDRTLPEDFSRAQEAIGSLAQTMNTARRAAVTLAGTLAPLALLWRVGWWAPVAVALASAVTVVASVRSARRRRRTDIELTEQRRRATYFFDTSFDNMAAKEARVFGMGEWLDTQYRTSFGAYLRRVWRVSMRQFRDEGLAEIGRLAVFGFVAMSSVVGTARGRLALGDPAAVLGAIFLLQQNVQYLAAVRANLIITTEHLPALWRIHDALPADARALPDGDADAPVPLRSGIRFEGVTFAYPSHDEPVVRGLDLDLPAGMTVALVGVNGAGKSTLVKLLARGYDPTAGRILVDGIDLRDLRIATWRARLGVVFQDFVRLTLSAADNVSLVQRDDAQLADAATASGADVVIERLTEGWDTMLARDLGGTDLSGGEWQRIALARCAARVAAGADVLVLDEPTAALDVRTEAEVVRQFRRLASGRTTLLISHRLSTVRVADRIAVLDGGRITELGSHDELLARGGTYASLWALQTAHLEEEEASL
jgi:ABC-type multidrug transport system fused ATPase/permease subunit